MIGTAADLRNGDEFWRADAWWTAETVRGETPRLGEPIVRVRARDPKGETHELTMPAGQRTVIVDRAEPVDA